MEFKTLESVELLIKEGAHVNQKCGRDNYCQIIQDDLIIGYMKPADYKILLSNDLYEEKRLRRTEDYRALKVIILKGRSCENL